VRGDGAVLLRKRKEDGLLGGMAEPPGTGWTARRDGATETSAAPFAADWRLAGRIQHVFTHFALDLTVFRADVGDLTAPPGHWWSGAIHGEALPTVMKKAIEAAIPGATRRRKH
jgi:A/G-specific adenine glycosylase